MPSLICLNAAPGDAWPETLTVPDVGEFAVDPDGATWTDEDTLAVTLERLDPSAAEDLRERLGPADPMKTRVVALSSSHWGTEGLETRIRALQPNVLLRRSPADVDLRELVVALGKLETGDIFGVEKYVESTDESTSDTLTSSVHVPMVLNRAESFLESLPVNRRIAERIGFVLDELLTNAVFNAPVDENGSPLFRDWDRTRIATLPSGCSAEFMMVRDGNTIALSVSDPFGSLSVETLKHHLRAAAGPLCQSVRRTGDGGAGIGIDQVIRASSRIVFNLEPGRRTEVIAFFDLLPTYRGYIQQPKSVSVFARPGGAA